MKTTLPFSTIFRLLIVFCILSCEGPEGPQGPAGVKGDVGGQGTAGVKGDKGDPGTANVKYTEWFTPDWNEFFRSSNNLYMLLNTSVTSQAILTDEAIDRSAIHTYIRYNERVWNNSMGEYELSQRITSSPTVWGYTKVPGRTANGENDFNQAMATYENIGKNYFKPRMQINTNIYDYNTQSEKVIEEYRTRTAAQIREQSKDIAQFRIVVIPGAVVSGRQKPVNFDNYEEVKATFGLKD